MCGALVLVLAGNFIMLIVGWALVGFASYALISYWYRRHTATKAGMIGFTRSMSKELAKRKITVNAVAPGTIIIPYEEKNNHRLPDVENILLKKYGKPSDIAEMVLFLANHGEYITGQVFTVDGGATIL